MQKSAIRSLLLATTLIAASPAAHADGTWIASPDRIEGSLRAGSRDVPVTPGSDTVLTIRNVKPGATFVALHGATVLNAEPVTADAKGAADIKFTVPADTQPGNHPLTVLMQNPPGVMLVNLKVSTVLAASNQGAFDLQAAPVGERAYQVAASTDGKLYVTSARGAKEESSLIRLDAATLAPEAKATLAASAKPADGLIDVFGLGVDDRNGRIWTTNTLNNTVTVYDKATLTVVKVFPEGSVLHPRDVVIDQANNRAYVNAALSGTVHVYDAATLEPTGTLFFEAAEGREVFGTMSLSLDAKAGRLYTLSRDSSWLGWADLASGKVTTIKVPQMRGGSGIAHDPETGRMFVTSQESNNLLVLDSDGKVLADTYVGAGGLSVAWNAPSKEVFVATRAGGTVSVLDVDGKLKANLPVGDLPNHLVVGPDDSVYVVSMYGAPNDKDQTGSVTRITAKN